MNIVKPNLLFYILLIVFISGCTTTMPVEKASKSTIKIPFAHHNQFSPQPEIIQANEILYLTDETKSDLNNYFYAKGNRHLTPNRRLSTYLERYVENYFYFNQTLTASESLDKSQGNCLSLAILTTAFADHLGIDIGYQLVDSSPVYQQENGIVLSSEHVRSLLYSPEPDNQSGTFFFNRSAIAIDYFPARNITIRRQVNRHEFISMYYRNKAAEAIIQQDNVLAYWLLRKSLEYKPTDHHSINMLALVHEYHGLKDYAEELFKYGLKESDEKLNLLRNYKIFLQREKRFKDANKIANKLASYHTENPFDWVKLGNNSLAHGKHSEAKRYFKRALKIAPYVHQAHFGIAKSEFFLGNRNAAKRALEKAKENSFEVKNKDLYQMKISALTNNS